MTSEPTVGTNRRRNAAPCRRIHPRRNASRQQNERNNHEADESPDDDAESKR